MEEKMTNQKTNEPLFPTTRTGGRLWANICTLLGIAWSHNIVMKDTERRMVELIRRLEGVEDDETAGVIHKESALPIVIDENGGELSVCSISVNYDGERKFPEQITLLHRDADGNEKLGTYRFFVAEDASDE
jgi:hypothetical protein